MIASPASVLVALATLKATIVSGAWVDIMGPRNMGIAGSAHVIHKALTACSVTPGMDSVSVCPDVGEETAQSVRCVHRSSSRSKKGALCSILACVDNNNNDNNNSIYL